MNWKQQYVRNSKPYEFPERKTYQDAEVYISRFAVLARYHDLQFNATAQYIDNWATHERFELDVASLECSICEEAFEPDEK